jgi:hypothetical protein
MLDRKPQQLSGGQRQRVALARAIIANNKICLMDEPLSNLDAQLRHEMRAEIRALQQKLKMTVVYVTHDQVEAMSMADRVVLLRDGKIEQEGTPAELYAKPATTFAARFIGTPGMNLVALGNGSQGVVVRGSSETLFQGQGDGPHAGPAPRAHPARKHGRRRDGDEQRVPWRRHDPHGSRGRGDLLRARAGAACRDSRHRGASSRGNRNRNTFSTITGGDHAFDPCIHRGGLIGFAPAAWADTELTFYYPIAVGGPLTKVIDGYAAEFEKQNPGVKVKPIYAGNYDDARIKALAALKAGQPAQISVLFSIDVYELLEQDVIMPWDDVATSAADQAWLKSFYPALMANGTYKNKVYGIPFQRSTIVLYWNKDAFKEAGLDPNKPPAELERDDADGAEAREEGRERQRHALGRHGALDRLRLLDVPGVRAPERPGPHESRRQPGELRASRRHRALQYWRDLGAKYKVMPEGTVEWGTLRQAFTEGKTAMMWHTTGNLTAVKDNAKFPFGVAMLPAVQAARIAHGRRQLLSLQEDHARGAQGRARLREVHDRARACGRLEHGDGLRRGLPGGLRLAEAEGIRHDLPAGRRRA